VVDEPNPIQKLASLMDDQIQISDSQSSKLDALMSMFGDEPTVVKLYLNQKLNKN
jgi:hypothetical protein